MIFEKKTTTFFSQFKLFLPSITFYMSPLHTIVLYFYSYTFASNSFTSVHTSLSSSPPWHLFPSPLLPPPSPSLVIFFPRLQHPSLSHFVFDWPRAYITTQHHPPLSSTFPSIESIFVSLLPLRSSTPWTHMLATHQSAFFLPRTHACVDLLHE